MARIATNVKIEVETALGTANTVTGLTKANPGVATYSGSDPTDGDIVVFSVTDGTVELDGQAVRVANTNTSAKTFELESLDTTDYSAWSSGSTSAVSTWATLGNSQSISMPNPAPAKIDITTLIDKTKQYAFGLPDAPDGTISGLYDPTSAGVQEVKAATKANGDRVFRVTWAGGQKTVFNALVSGGSGFDSQQNQAVTATISVTPVKDIMDYAT